MTTEITNQIAQCEVCRALETKQQKESDDDKEDDDNLGQHIRWRIGNREEQA